MSEFFTKRKIRLARTLGEKLKVARKRKLLNLEEAERETKISMKYLSALEHSRFDELPADVYVHGFLARYADYLGIKKNEIINQFEDEKQIFNSVRSIKRHSDQNNKNLIKPEPSKKWLEGPKFYITPELVISTVVIAVVTVMMGYIWLQVKSFAAAPDLEIKNPEAEIVVSMDSMNIEGKTDANANLIINGEGVAINQDGSFNQKIELTKGINTIEIIARNKANKESKRTIQVLSK